MTGILYSTQYIYLSVLLKHIMCFKSEYITISFKGLLRCELLKPESQVCDMTQVSPSSGVSDDRHMSTLLFIKRYDTRYEILL